MRLSAAERAAIRDAVHAVLGAGAGVRLFGSRVDDTARGGDIDVLVEADRPIDDPVVLGARIGARIQRAIGDQRVDVLVTAPNLVDEAIHRVARATSVAL